jgi:glycerate kinase
LNDLPAALSSLAEIDITSCDKRIKNTRIIILCDVENPLLGSNGAATIFGPQKGASEKDIQQLENMLTRFNEIVLRKTGKEMSTIEHGGAAGGVAAGLYTFLNADLVNGIDYFLHITGFEKELIKSQYGYYRRRKYRLTNFTWQRTIWRSKKGKGVFFASYRYGRKSVC